MTWKYDYLGGKPGKWSSRNEKQKMGSRTFTKIRLANKWSTRTGFHLRKSLVSPPQILKQATSPPRHKFLPLGSFIDSTKVLSEMTLCIIEIEIFGWRNKWQPEERLLQHVLQELFVNEKFEDMLVEIEPWVRAWRDNFGRHKFDFC